MTPALGWEEKKEEERRQNDQVQAAAMMIIEHTERAVHWAPDNHKFK